jgi:FtsP/CotA-like multicopper oxidase with cupredoxin domain
MKSIQRLFCVTPVLGIMLMSSHVEAQSFRVQCPTNTTFQSLPTVGGTIPSPGGIKCQQIAGGDGYATMGNGNTIYMFGFGPLSGLDDIYHGLPGTQPNSLFNTTLGPVSGTPSSLVGMPDGSFTFNGAIGLTEDFGINPWTKGTVYLKGATVRVGNDPTAAIYTAASDGTAGGTPPTGTDAVNTVSDGGVSWLYQGSLLDGHVDPRPVMDVGVMNASQPAPLIAIDEDDELFLTLSNVGMIMRPDLFEQHTVHFHGYPNASAFYDGVPDASIAIAIGGSFTYYYLAPDAGTYFWHCHISPPEHLQMGMVGQLYVRPRQNRVAANASLYTALSQWEASNTALPAPTANPATPADWSTYEPVRKRCGTDILCSTPLPANASAKRAVMDTDHPNGGAAYNYAYNDGDGSTYYDVEYPIQIHGFDPNFHFVGMTFNPESFNDMKDKYFMLNGRSYPDTVGGHTCTASDTGLVATATHPEYVGLQACQGKSVGMVVAGPMQTQSSDGTYHASQPLPTVINIPVNGHALLRISDLDVSEYQTLASLGIPMRVVGLNARLLRDMAGNNLAYKTNSITLAGGESIDVILDATNLTAGQKFYLYTPNLDHLSNDAENFGGLMTEVNICTSVDPTTKACTI